MPDEIHHFHLESTWTGDSAGDGLVRAGQYQIEYGLPVEFGGSPTRTNPEELLMSSVAACYSLTLAYLAERRKLPVDRIEMKVEGDVLRQAGGTLKFVAIRLFPRVFLGTADESSIQTATDFAHKADQYCLISNAIRGSVELSVSPEIVTGG